MANVQKAMTDVSASLERHSFDLSERHLFSAKVGQLLPVYCKQTVPGDYFEIDPVSFLRSMKLNQAAYARVRQHIDFFFVPYSQLWHKFPEFKYQRLDPISANEQTNVINNRKPIYSPSLTLEQLYNNVLMVNQNSSNEVTKDEFGFYDVPNRVRLCDLLGYGCLRNYIRSDYQHSYQPVSSAVPHNDDLGSKSVTIWPWLAYQKIWSDFYRNPWYDVSVDPSNFNVDDVPGYSIATANIQNVRQDPLDYYSRDLDGIFKLRYRQWKKDYFTGLFPDQQFGDVSMVVGSSKLLLSPTDGQSHTLSMASSTDLNGPGVVYGQDVSSVSYSGVYLAGGISALDVRRSELLQVWKEKVLRAGYRSESQQEAHFGVRSEYISDQHVKVLGGVSAVLDINEVVSTSMNVGGSESLQDGLGEIAGKSQSLASGEKIRFNCKDDGLIMAIFSLLPESEYPAFGVSAEHMRIEPFDYFTPAFQNVGFKAVIGAELDLTDMISDTDGEDVPGNRRNKVLGFAPPYYDMKIGIDKVHGEFIPDVPRSSDMNILNDNPGSLASFDIARRNALNTAGTLNFFYVSPRVTDSIFAKDVDSYEDTDQFYVNMYLDIKADRPMSVLGLPNF